MPLVIKEASNYFGIVKVSLEPRLGLIRKEELMDMTASVMSIILE